MRSSRTLIILLMAFFIASLSSYAQTKTRAAEEMSVKLQQKVLLSKDQTEKVKDILANYFSNMDKATLEMSKKSVESILDKKQKAKYDIIKNDWWSSVQKAADKEE
jgi:uncharacterized membrane protein